DAQHMERERDLLVKTLRAGGLPPGGQVLAREFVPAESHPIAELLARLALGLLGGLVAGVLAWLALRFARAEKRDIAAVAGTGEASTRLAWTVVGIGIFLMGSQIMLPGVNEVELEHVVAKSGSYWRDLTQLSVFAIG